jgi:hypothetical protein
MLWKDTISTQPSFSHLHGLIIFFELSCYCCTGGTLWHLQKFLQCILVIFTPPSFCFIHPSPFLEQSQQVSLFHFFKLSIQYFYHIHPPSPFPYIFPHLSGINSQTGLVLLYCSSFLKRRYFCLFKIAIQGVSLCHVQVYTYYTPNWFIPSFFLLSY